MSDPAALEGALSPEETPALVGHETAWKTLGDQLAARRLPGAILLHGPLGIGKATFAFALARAVLEATGDEDAHRVFEQVAAHAHPNLSVLRRAPRDGKGHYTVIRVEDVRTLRESLTMTRGRAGHRIAIVDAIDEANASAANALLKTLEEPPAETSFILVAHQPGALLPTIRSRCQSIALRPLGPDAVAEAVRRQRSGIEAEALARAVALAGGRPRRALMALDLKPDSSLSALGTFLEDPLAPPSAVPIALADALGADANAPEFDFARELLFDALAREGREAAVTGERRRLASANALWEKAVSRLAAADALNIDMKQTLLTIFDAMRAHFSSLPPPAESPKAHE